MEPDLEHLLTRGVAEIIVREELEQKLRSGRKLRLKISAPLIGNLAIVKDEIQDVFLEDILVENSDGRNTKAFLEDMRMAPIHEVGVVGEVGYEGHQFSIYENR